LSTRDYPPTPSPEQIRKELQNIVDSYGHAWDIVAELSQNAIDAIRKYDELYPGSKREHEIAIKLDNVGRSISIRDTGAGFAPSNVEYLMSPQGTDKDFAGSKLIGRKGVGLTYVIAMSDTFELVSKSVDGNVQATVTGTSSWRRGQSEARPVMRLEVADTGSESTETGTTLTVKNIDRREGVTDFFDLNEETQQLVLRTKTALGWTAPVFGLGDRQSSVRVTITNTANEVREQPFLYMLPTEFLSPGDIISRDEAVDQMATMDEEQRRRLLRNKAIFRTASGSIAGRSIRAYAFFAPNANSATSIWKKINFRNELPSESADTLESTVQSAEDQFGYQPGIFVATRGMPTGIELTHPRVGSSGYWSSMFVLIEDDGLDFDLGRKSINPPDAPAHLRKFAGDIFKDLIRFASYFSGEPSVGAIIAPLRGITKDEEFERLEKLADLAVPKVSFLKHPSDQEAAISALFHELVGGGLLRGYRTLSVGYKKQYDWWGHYILNKEYVGKAHWENFPKEKDYVRTIIEFKYVAESLIADFEEVKSFFDISLLVCWDFNESKLRQFGFIATPLPPDNALYNGANFVLESVGGKKLGAAGKIEMICLRYLMQELTRSGS
jgi:molecular chaperone HtpG